MNIRVNTSKFEFDSTKTAIILNFNSQVLEQFHAMTFLVLNREIAKGNNRYSTVIDGRPANGKEDIPKAKRMCRFGFVQEQLQLALDIMIAELSGAIRASVTRRTGDLESTIQVFLAKKGKHGFKEILKRTELADFAPGDTVAVCASMPYAGIVNHYVTQASSVSRTAKKGLTKARRNRRGKTTSGGNLRKGEGFLALAAKKIRTKILQTRRGGGISIRGGYSMALVPLVFEEAVNPKLIGQGIPCIFIEYRYNQTVNVVGG